MMFLLFSAKRRSTRVSAIYVLVRNYGFAPYAHRVSQRSEQNRLEQAYDEQGHSLSWLLLPYRTIPDNILKIYYQR